MQMLDGIGGLERPRRRSFPRIHLHDLHPTTPNPATFLSLRGAVDQGPGLAEGLCCFWLDGM